MKTVEHLAARRDKYFSETKPDELKESKYWTLDRNLTPNDRDGIENRLQLGVVSNIMFPMEYLVFFNEIVSKIWFRI